MDCFTAPVGASKELLESEQNWHWEMFIWCVKSFLDFFTYHNTLLSEWIAETVE